MDFMKMLDKCTGEEMLQKHIDMDRANKEQSYFCGTVEQCDICQCYFRDQQYLVDCELKDKPGWCYMCGSCFSKHGKGIGYGVGQLYMRQPNGKWLKVGGFAP